MGLLDRLRLGVVLADRVVLAGEAERLVREAALEDRDGLRQAGLTHGRRVERQADRLVLGPVPAGADGDVEPALAEDVEARQVLRQHGGMAEVVVQDECADAQGLADRGDGRHRRRRRELRDEVIGHDQRVDPDGLGAADRLGQLSDAGDSSRIGEEAERTSHVVIVTEHEPPRDCGAPAPRHGCGAVRSGECRGLWHACCHVPLR